MVKKGHPWRQSGPAPKKLPMYYSGRRRVFFLQTQFFKHLLQVSLIFCFSIELSLYTYNFLLCPRHKNSHWRYSNERCLLCLGQILKIQLIFSKQRRNRVSKSVVKPKIRAITCMAPSWAKKCLNNCLKWGSLWLLVSRARHFETPIRSIILKN